MPGGVNSPARAFGGVGGEPIFIQQADGPWLVDIDGNRYLDYIGSWGPMILGHGHPAVVAALEAAVRRGTSYGAPTLQETELAELIIEAVPSVEKVRLVNSGTEATMSAIRLARGYTGRPIVIKFAGNYHGHVDSLLVAAGSSAATLGVPNSPGVTEGTARDTLVLPYNDPAALEDAFARVGDRVAGVIFEPVVGNMGCVVPSEAFRFALRDLTSRYGALLICDEVMTGFRVAYGGAQSLWQMKPDLTTLGKGDRRRAARGGLRGSSEDHGSRAARRQGLSGRHAQRQPPGHRGRHRHPESAPRQRCLLSPGTFLKPTGRRFCRGGPDGEDSPHAGPRRLDDDAVLQSAARDRLERGGPQRHAAVRQILLGHARSRRLPALQPVRGVIRLDGAQRRTD